MDRTTSASYPVKTSIEHWLACGTITSPIEVLANVVPPDGAAFGQDKRWVLNYWAWSKPSKRIKKRIYQALPPFNWKPQENPHLGAKGISEKDWRYARTGEDQDDVTPGAGTNSHAVQQQRDQPVACRRARSTGRG